MDLAAPNSRQEMLTRYIQQTLIALLLPISMLRAQVVVTGTVTDSLSHRPVVGAVVQLANDALRFVRSTNTDSLGVFRIDSVRPGQYIIGFFHPTLDSLGIDLSPKQITVSQVAEQHVDLAIPSAHTVVTQLCRSTPDRDSTGLLVGHIRDAETGQPRTGTVTVLWMELLIGKGGVTRNRQQIPIKTGDIGDFAMCGLPTDVDVQATAVAGNEESGVVELHLPPGGLLLRDFLVSTADSTVAVVEDSSDAKGASTAPMLRRGSARVSGVVHNDKGKPVANAQVIVPGTGVDGRTEETGTFSLAGLPSGTQTVEVRAIGFEPKRVAVDLTRQHLTTLDVVLDRPVQTLDAVKIYGKGDVAMAQFQRRLKAGWGHILTPADIAKRNAFQVSDLFRTIPGVRVSPTRGFGNRILIRGCQPTVYFNGMRMDDQAASEIDMLASASEITAVEVYTASARPAEFFGNSCGTVVLWAGMLPR
jgi:Carboxypeptidase regulatory-like domain/TonB-dependent Receptor Plug Domain